MKRAARTSVLVTAVALAMTLAGCKLPAFPSSSTGPTAEQLASVEVTSFHGKKLGSIEDFRENSIKGVQHIDRKTYRLHVTGLVDRPLSLTYEDVVKRKPFDKVVTLNCVEGWSVTVLWRGVLIRDLLKEAGVRPDAKVVIFRCHDGYSTSFPIGYFTDKDILLAYRMNGVPLPDERGWPFQVLAEDKWGYKWAKWVETIEVSSDANYRGFWESRGYSNDGSLKKGFFSP